MYNGLDYEAQEIELEGAGAASKRAIHETSSVIIYTKTFPIVRRLYETRALAHRCGTQTGFKIVRSFQAM